MNKSELVKAVATSAELTQQEAGRALDAAFEVITGQLKAKNTVSITGFGTFEARERKAREGRNPATGAPVQIKAKTSAAWKPAAALKDL